MRAQKPLLVIRETDPNHGAATQQGLRDEVAQVDMSQEEQRACVHLIEHGSGVLEWHREAHLKRATLRLVVQALFSHSAGETPELRVLHRDDAGSQHFAQAEVYVSPHYQQVTSFHASGLTDAFTVVSREQRTTSTPVAIFLCPGMFEHPELVDELR